MSILSVWRPPFTVMPVVAHLPEGLTLAEMAAQMPGLPDDFAGIGVICVNGHPVPRACWAVVRPKPQAAGVPVEVTFHAPPQGGGGEGGNSGKKVFALIASIGLSVISGGIAAGSAVKLFGAAFAKGTLAAKALAFGVSLSGALLIGALSAPPVSKRQGRQAANEGSAGVEGNALEANAALPRVIGERKVFPPLACEPLTYFDGADEIVEAVYALAGPHRLLDVRIGNAAAATMVGVEVETREGWPGDTALRLVTRQGRTDAVQTELRGHLVDEDDGAKLDTTQDDLAASLPQAFSVVTREAPDVHMLHLAFPQGLHIGSSDSDRMRVPVRLRLRLLGDADWINLPELHFQAANLRQMRATIELRWTDEATADPQAANGEGFVAAFRAVPGQTALPETAGWVADAYFGAGGQAWLVAGNLGATGVEHVEMTRYTARILLDPAEFPRGRYEIEVLRGAAFSASSWSDASYQLSGSVWDLFGYRGIVAPMIAQSRDGVVDSLYLLRSCSVWNEAPIAADGLALIAVRARNRTLDALSVVAGGWVRDWDGAGWNTWAVTANPAPHLRDIYAGMLSSRPVPAALIDDAGLVAWRTDCIAQGYGVNHLSEDESVMQAARVVAGCGYAQPYMSDVFGVVRDYDRSAEGPVQIFTPRNSRGFGFTRALPVLPDGFRVTYRDALRDYEERQIVVARPGFTGVPVITEQVELDGLVTEGEVRARAIYDLRSAELRGTFYRLEAPAEAIICRRGDLVGVNHDAMTQWMGSGRIVDLGFTGSDVTSITLDSVVDLTNEPDLQAVTDMHAVADMHLLGRASAALIRGVDGPMAAVPLTNASGASAVLELSTGIDPADLALGGLVAVGLTASETLRLIVFDVTPAEDLTATLTFVDESSELFAA